MKKKIIIPMLMLSCLFLLAGCSKVSLTSGATDKSGAPTEGGTPPMDGGTPPDNSGTPPSDGDIPPIGGQMGD